MAVSCSRKHINSEILTIRFIEDEPFYSIIPKNSGSSSCTEKLFSQKLFGAIKVKS